MTDPDTQTAPLDPRVVHLSTASGLAADRGWVQATAEYYDLVHWHGDVEELSAADAHGLVESLRRAGRPLVVSLPADPFDSALPVHDLGDLDGWSALVPAAAAVLVADPAAASVVWRVWGRTCLVVDEEDDGLAERLYRAVLANQPFATESLEEAGLVGGVAR